MRRGITLACATAALVVGAASAASAAPPEREAIPLVCDNGETYNVVVNGNGEFTPGRVVGSTQVVIPVSFADFFFRAELPTGEVIEEMEPGVSSKGGGNVAAHSPRPRTTCTFEITETLDEEEDGLPAGTEVTFGGTVTVFVTGRR